MKKKKIPLLKVVFTKLPYTRFHFFIKKLLNFNQVITWKGLRINVNPSYTDEYYLYFFGDFWNSEIDEIVKLSNKSKIFADIGCNIGLFSLAVAKSNDYIKIYSFDPNVDIEEKIKTNLDLNPQYKSRIKFIKNAVGSKNQELNFSSNPKDPSIGRILIDETKNNSYKVKTINLDSFFYERKTYPDIVKIDVEGYELEVLKGMKGLISIGYPKIMFIETHAMYFPGLEEKFNSKIIEKLKSENYKIRHLNGKQIESIDSLGRTRRSNLVAIKNNIPQ